MTETSCTTSTSVATLTQHTLMEEENSRLKHYVSLINNFLEENNDKNHVDSRKFPRYATLSESELSIRRSELTANISQLQVRADLERDRRQRLQVAVEEAEKRCYNLERQLESKEREQRRFRDNLANFEAIKKGLESQLQVEEAKNRLLESDKNRMKSDFHKVIEEIKREKEEVMSQLEDSRNRNELLEYETKALQTLIVEMETTKRDENSSQREEITKMNKEEFNQTNVSDNDSNKEEKTIDQATNSTSASNEGRSEMDENREKREDASTSTSKEASKITSRALLESKMNNEIGWKLSKSCENSSNSMSVSATFLRLRDLIMEKRLLEAEVSEMRAANLKLSQQVQRHESRLFSVTEQLNHTWTLITALKDEHRQLHTSEKILRAELLEKRVILTQLREELEFSRQTWKIVKQKTAESERIWKELRDEFAARHTSSESGFEDEDEDNNKANNNNEKSNNESENNKDFDKDKNDELHEKEQDLTSIIFVPSLYYLAEVPAHLQPRLLFSDDFDFQTDFCTGKDGEINNESTSINSVDNISSNELINDFDNDLSEVDFDLSLDLPFNEGVEVDVSNLLSRASSLSSLDNDLDEDNEHEDNNNDSNENNNNDHNIDNDLKSNDNNEEEEENDDEQANQSNDNRSINENGPNNDDLVTNDDDSCGDESDVEDNVSGNLASSDLTRLLLKQLPQQIQILKEDKMQLEERIQDLETRLTDRNSVINEMERRETNLTTKLTLTNTMNKLSLTDKIGDDQVLNLPFIAFGQEAQVRWSLFASAEITLQLKLLRIMGEEETLLMEERTQIEADAVHVVCAEAQNQGEILLLNVISSNNQRLEGRLSIGLSASSNFGNSST